MRKKGNKTLLGEPLIRFAKKLPEDRNYFITSDLHFGHTNILKFCPKTRPWADRDEMTKALIAEWNAVVKPGDVVFHVGDFSFMRNAGAVQAIIDALNGTIVHIMGNHDEVVRENIASDYKFDYFECRYKGIKICMSHYAMREWNQKGRGSVMLFGHSHGSLKVKGRSVDVGYDSMGRIMPLDEVLEQLMKIEDLDVGDHH